MRQLMIKLLDGREEIFMLSESGYLIAISKLESYWTMLVRCRRIIYWRKGKTFREIVFEKFLSMFKTSRCGVILPKIHHIKTMSYRYLRDVRIPLTNQAFLSRYTRERHLSVPIIMTRVIAWLSNFLTVLKNKTKKKQWEKLTSSASASGKLGDLVPAFLLEVVTLDAAYGLWRLSANDE